MEPLLSLGRECGGFLVSIPPRKLIGGLASCFPIRSDKVACASSTKIVDRQLHEAVDAEKTIPTLFRSERKLTSYYMSNGAILHSQTLAYISFEKENIMDAELPPTLLYVEDELLIQISTKPVLEDAGFEVLTADNGAQALEIIEDEKRYIDGLVTDVNLGPGPSGWNVARYAREQVARIPVMYASSVDKDEWMARGVPLSELVSKPFGPSRLAGAISKLMASAGHPGHPTGCQKCPDVW